MSIQLNVSGKELRLLDTALISQINHYQTMVDDYRKEMGSPDCAGYLDCLVDLEKCDSRRKRDYEKLRLKIKAQILIEALKDFRSEKTRAFRELGDSARRYLLHTGSGIREAYQKLGDSLVK